MPSKKRQLNIRPDEDTWRLMDELIPVVSEAIGLKVTQTDLFRLGLLCLKKQYAPGAAAGEPEKPAVKKKPGKK